MNIARNNSFSFRDNFVLTFSISMKLQCFIGAVAVYVNVIHSHKLEDSVMVEIIEWHLFHGTMFLGPHWTFNFFFRTFEGNLLLWYIYIYIYIWLKFG